MAMLSGPCKVSGCYRKDGCSSEVAIKRGSALYNTIMFLDSTSSVITLHVHSLHMYSTLHVSDTYKWETLIMMNYNMAKKMSKYRIMYLT